MENVAVKCWNVRWISGIKYGKVSLFYGKKISKKVGEAKTFFKGGMWKWRKMTTKHNDSEECKKKTEKRSIY